MPRLEHWIIASKDAEVLAPEISEALQRLGAELGSGWYKIHQHICVGPYNKEQIEDALAGAGYTVLYASEQKAPHPELHPECVYDDAHDPSRPENAGWLVVSRMLPVLDNRTLATVVELGGQIAGGWCEVHQHVRVEPSIREVAMDLLHSANLTVTPVVPKG